MGISGRTLFSQAHRGNGTLEGRIVLLAASLVFFHYCSQLIVLSFEPRPLPRTVGSCRSLPPWSSPLLQPIALRFEPRPLFPWKAGSYRSLPGLLRHFCSNQDLFPQLPAASRPRPISQLFGGNVRTEGNLRYVCIYVIWCKLCNLHIAYGIFVIYNQVRYE